MDTKTLRRLLNASNATISTDVIRAAYAAGATVKQIARELGLGAGYIASLVR
jgi:hypothetical protein